MDNPWLNIPKVAPFVLPEDRLGVQRAATFDQKFKPRFELPPDPFIGAVSSSDIVLLCLNPRFDDANVDERRSIRGLQDANMRTLCGDGTLPFYYLDRAFERALGYRWWFEKLESLILACGHDAVRSRVSCIQYFPYHSQNYKRLGITLPSQYYGFWLANEALKSHKLIVIMRASAAWALAVPALKEHPVITLRCPARPVLTEGNMDPGEFDRLVRTIKGDPAGASTALNTHSKEVIMTEPQPSNRDEATLEVAFRLYEILGIGLLRFVERTLIVREGWRESTKLLPKAVVSGGNLNPDPNALTTIITQGDNWRDVFSGAVSTTDVRSWLYELKNNRNLTMHFDPGQDMRKLIRAFDTAELVLEAISSDQVTQLQSLRERLKPVERAKDSSAEPGPAESHTDSAEEIKGEEGKAANKDDSGPSEAGSGDAPWLSSSGVTLVTGMLRITPTGGAPADFKEFLSQYKTYEAFSDFRAIYQRYLIHKATGTAWDTEQLPADVSAPIVSQSESTIGGLGTPLPDWALKLSREVAKMRFVSVLAAGLAAFGEGAGFERVWGKKSPYLMKYRG